MYLYSNSKKQSGFGLLEVLIAILVLSVSAVAFIKLQHGGMKEVRNTSMRIEAVRVMSNVVEAFKANKESRDKMMNKHSGKWATDARERGQLEYYFSGFKKCSDKETPEINASPSSWCSDFDAWRYQELMIRRYLSTDLMVMDGNRSGLCITKKGTDNYRFTVVWKKVTENNFNTPSTFGMRDCPRTYDERGKYRGSAEIEAVDMYVRF